MSVGNSRPVRLGTGEPAAQGGGIPAAASCRPASARCVPPREEISGRRRAEVRLRTDRLCSGPAPPEKPGGFRHPPGMNHSGRVACLQPGQQLRGFGKRLAALPVQACILAIRRCRLALASAVMRRFQGFLLPGLGSRTCSTSGYWRRQIDSRSFPEKSGVVRQAISTSTGKHFRIPRAARPSGAVRGLTAGCAAKSRRREACLAAWSSCLRRLSIRSAQPSSTSDCSMYRS